MRNKNYDTLNNLLAGVLVFAGIASIFIGVMLFIIALMALPTMWLWNWLMPILFGLKTITFWQAMGLNMLTSILFKSVIPSSGQKK